MYSCSEQRMEIGTVSGNLGETVARDMHQLRETCLSRVETLITELETRCEAHLKTRDQQIDSVKGKDTDLATV